MKRLFLVLLVLLSGMVYSYAQSTVYFFSPQMMDNKCMIKLNGKEVFEMRGPLKKVMTPQGYDPFRVYSPCYRKCLFRNEGKMLFILEVTSTKDNRKWTAEIQLNLTEGSVHYVKMGAKGLNDVQFTELTQKEGEKLLKNKKYIPLDDYVEK